MKWTATRLPSIEKILKKGDVIVVEKIGMRIGLLKFCAFLPQKVEPHAFKACSRLFQIALAPALPSGGALNFDVNGQTSCFILY